MADTTAPSGDWLDRVLNVGTDFGEKWLDYRAYDLFGPNESQQADQQDQVLTDYWGGYPNQQYQPPAQNNTMLYVGIGVAVLAVILLMKK